jgi:glycosyltransferase involved in cell wall biosynthesis
VREQAQRAHATCIERVLRGFPIKLIHFHGLDFHSYLPRAPVPKLATLHLPLGWYSSSIFAQPDLHLCCVSENQAQSATNGLKLPVVTNGIEVDRFRAGAVRENYLLWLGRICPEKGTDIALRVAQRLNSTLIVAGPVHRFGHHQAYFSAKVLPLLDERRQYIGAIGLKQKVELLAAARCVLIPSLVAETGSLVAMEAISSGAPVIAFRSGALPEIIEHGVTGFIVDSEEEMAEAVNRAPEISPSRCREQALRRFDAARMIEDYLKLYGRVLASE